jgi:hypothetical protein
LQLTTVMTVPNADHFLGSVPPFVDDALRWIDRVAGRASLDS